MKTSIYSLLITGFVILTYTSCTKDTSSTDNSVSTKVKTYTEEVTYGSNEHIVETFNLNYDGNDRLISMVQVSDPGNRFEYQYPDSHTFVMDLFSNDQVAIHETFYLNSLLLLDSTLQYNDTEDTVTEKYLYNAANQLMKVKEYDYSISTGSNLYNTTNYTYDNDGNIIAETDGSYTRVYTYDSVLINAGNTLMAFPQNFKSFKQLPTSEVYTSGGDSYTLTHTYSFDASNRLTRDRTELSNGEVGIKSYTYY